MSEFDRGTAVTRTGDDTFEANVSKDWWVFTGANGGYLASVLLRALTERLGDPARMARSLNVQYLRPPAEGPATVTTRLVRAGRSLATVTASMAQDGNEVALATGVFAVSRPSMTFQDLSMPAAPEPETIEPQVWPPELTPPIAHRFDYLPVAGSAVFAGAERAEVAAWLRLRDPRAFDPLALATAVDALAPAVFPKATAPVLATTVDLTVHFRAPADTPPAGGWCLATFRSTVGVDGFVEEDGEVWSRSGTLLAQSRQLALVLPLS